MSSRSHVTDCTFLTEAGGRWLSADWRCRFCVVTPDWPPDWGWQLSSISFLAKSLEVSCPHFNFFPFLAVVITALDIFFVLSIFLLFADDKTITTYTLQVVCGVPAWRHTRALVLHHC